jgi:Mismatch repair ATPase (MutS family)
MTHQHTPLMQQYFTIKSEYPDTILMFQVGDFYELFFDDAKTAASFLGIALTSRGKDNGDPIPLCGVPIHAKDHYLNKLVKGGFKVALCDQLEEATPGKLVKRSVTHVMTPGTLTDATLLDDKSASYLFAFYPGQSEWALVFGELLTAQLWATVIPAGSNRILESELSRFFPDELLIPDNKDAKQFIPFFKQQGYFTTLVNVGSDETMPSLNQSMQDTVNQHSSLAMALKYFYAYLSKNQVGSLDQFTSIFMYQPDDFLHLDAPTQRNLELIKNSQDGGSAHTLFSIMDGATTPMGSRMIKKMVAATITQKTSNYAAARGDCRFNEGCGLFANDSAIAYSCRGY